MKIKHIFVLLFFFSTKISSQISPDNIEIVRDSYGVPHI